jgi:putative nucleotidyltransferase with HDIG domain
VPAAFNQQLTKDMVLAKVPAFSPGILRVIDLLSQEDRSVTELAQAIAADAALAAQVLRLANSALSGAQCRIDTVEKAVVAFGQPWIQHLTLTLGASSYMKAASQTDELKRCWRHMLTTAVLSRELARAAGLPADRAYVLGLLHDIGRLGLLAAFPSEYAGALESAPRGSASILDQERKTFAVDHCELGRCMVESWNLPAEFSSVVGRHHDLSGGGEIDTLRVVQLACRLADTLGFFFIPPAMPLSLEDVRSMLPAFAQQSFPAEDARLAAIVEEALSENELGGAEPLPPPPPVVEVVPEPELQPLSNWGWIAAAVVGTFLAIVLAARWLW